MDAASDTKLFDPDDTHALRPRTKETLPKVSKANGRVTSPSDDESSSEELVSSSKLEEKDAEIARLKQSLKISAERREKAERDRQELEAKMKRFEAEKSDEKPAAVGLAGTEFLS